MLSKTLQVILLDNYEAQRRQFLDGVKLALGATPVACYFPHRNDNLTSLDPYSGRVWTADAAMAGQITPLGKGSQRTFNGTSNYLTTPDTANLSFGNSLLDSAVTFVGVANVTDTAAGRRLMAKFTDTTHGEYSWGIDPTDHLSLTVIDQSTGAAPVRASTAVITQAAWHVFSSTYSAAVGGALAADDMSNYQDGLLIASTSTNNAGYVAMEDSTEIFMVGASASAAPAGFFAGGMAFAAVMPGNVLAAGHLAFNTLCKSYFGI